MCCGCDFTSVGHLRVAVPPLLHHGGEPSALLRRRRRGAQLQANPEMVGHYGSVAHEPLRSARVNGYPQAALEQLPDRTRIGLVSLLLNFLDRDWFASAFPTHSENWNVYYVSGTDNRAFYDLAEALVDGLSRPWRSDELEDDQIFDLIEFCGRHVHKPSAGGRANELKFDRGAGRAEFYQEVNELLRASGSVFTLSGGLRIERKLSPETAEVLHQLTPATGDATLDGYVQRAREGILSRTPAARAHALQEFWGAFDYLKTADVPGRGNKRKSIDVLLASLPTDEMRRVVNADMNALKEAGNTFRIRHHETDAVDLTESEKDYLAGRMANVLLMLLRASARLTPA